MMGTDQNDYWNRVASKKKFTTKIDYLFFSEFVGNNSRIVDYGCGYGRTLDELYQRGFTNSIGFDFAKEMINRGNKEFPHLDLQVAKNNKIPCETSSVDMVLLLAVLTCIVDDLAQRRLIAEIQRVLKPNGYVYINDFLINTDKRNFERYTKYDKKYHNYGVFELPEGVILRHHSPTWIANLLKGFKEIIFQKVNFTTMNGNNSNGFMYIGRARE